MAVRLPTVGGDDGTWGTVLNSYLQTEHNTDGTHGLASGLVTDVVTTVAASTSAYTIVAPTTSGITDLTLTANCTLTFPTAVAGQSFTLILKQDGTGSRTVTWPDTVKWNGGVDPTLTTTASGVDILGFFTSDGTNWYGFVSGQDMK